MPAALTDAIPPLPPLVIYVKPKERGQQKYASPELTLAAKLLADDTIRIEIHAGGEVGRKLLVGRIGRVTPPGRKKPRRM